MTNQPTARYIRSRSILALVLLGFAMVACSKKQSSKGAAEHGDHDKHSGKDKHGGKDKHSGKDKHGDKDKHGGKDKHDDEVLKLTPQAVARAKIRTTAVSMRVLSGVIETTGEVAFDQDRVAHVSPRIPGRVYRVKSKLGDVVKARQALAIIDSIALGRAKADYLRSRAQLALARQNLAREEKLLKEKIASGREVLDARAAHQKALADYRAARQRLRLLGLYQGHINGLRYDRSRAALLAVRSPIAGKIIKKHVTLGELVTPKSNLFTVADLSRVWIWIDVYERNLAAVHLKDTVKVTVSAYASRVFSGEVTYISDQIDRDTRAVRARLDIKNADGALKPGMFARVRLTDPHATGSKKPRRKGLAVPTSAIQRDGKRRIVFVQLAKGRFERRVVKVGVEAEGYAEILTGVKAGQLVVTNGAFILKSEASKKAMGGGHSH